MMKRKIILLSVILFSAQVVCAQLTLKSSIALKDYEKRLNFEYGFKVFGNAFYVSVECKILKFSLDGVLIDSINLSDGEGFCTTSHFEVQNVEGKEIITTFNKNSILTFENGVLKSKIFLSNIIDSTKERYFGIREYCLISPKKIYILYHNIDDFQNNYDSLININNTLKIETKALKKYSIVQPGSFAVLDSFLVTIIHGRKANNYCYDLIVSNLNSTEVLKYVSIDSLLGLKNSCFGVSRIIGGYKDKSYTVYSPINSDIDYIISLDVNRLNAKKVLSLSKKSYDLSFSSKVEKSLFSDSRNLFLNEEYPNERWYSIANKQLYVFYKQNGKRLIDIYDLEKK